MFTKARKWIVALLALLVLTVPAINAQDLQRSDDDNQDYGQDRDYNRGDRTRIDRYLDAELWTNHSDDEFYIGDNIVLNYRVNEDAFVAVYSVDSRGRVRMLFPSDPGDDNYVRGGVTYRLPSGNDNYDLSVSGPEGTESIQIIASRERFPLPDWYRGGLQSDASDRDEYMDWLNTEYFVRYDGQRFAYDRVRIYVNEWEPDYFRPVYHPVYPHWSVCGNVYFDYPWGASVYIDGIYWGCTPMYIPTILVGWHTFTVYDPWGHCWENDVHIVRNHTVILDRTVIFPRATVVSKYKEVRRIGYRDPVTNGYPNFHQVIANKTVLSGGGRITASTPLTRERLEQLDKSYTPQPKRYARSVVPIEKTDRGWEAKGVGDNSGRRTFTGNTYRDGANSGAKSYTPGANERSRRVDVGSTERSTYRTDNNTGNKSGNVETRQNDGSKQQSSSGYNQKRSDGNTGRSGEVQHRTPVQPSGGNKSGTVSSGGESRKSSGSGTSGNSGNSGQSNRTEAKSKSSGGGERQQPAGKSGSDGGGHRSGGRR